MSNFQLNLLPPSYVKEDSSGCHTIDLMSEHLTKRRLFLIGDITDETANEFVAKLLKLAETPEPITLIINSGGGSVAAGMVIYNSLQFLEKEKNIEVNAYVCGLAASMASIILCGATNRYAMQNSKVMIHQASIGSFGGKLDSVKRVTESLNDTMNMLIRILSDRTGKTPEQIEEDTKFDNFFTAEEAIDYNLIDGIGYPY